jgi:hypothetical protein
MISRIAAVSMLWLLVAMVFSTGASRAAEGDSSGVSFEIVPIWSHVHSTIEGDDGSVSPDGIKKHMQSDGYKGLILTPHTREKLHFPEVREWADRLNAPDFVVVAGREVAARVVTEVAQGERPLCHMVALGDSDDILARDNVFTDEQLTEQLAKLDEESAFYWWGHPWTCPQWIPYANLFYGIEMFNGATEASYNVSKNAYFGALRSGKNLFVTSGIDMHVLAQALIGDYYTYVMPDEFTRKSLAEAMTAGHTIAGFNAKVLFINRRPSFEFAPVSDGNVTISGGLAIKPLPGVKLKLVIHKNGAEYTPSVPPELTLKGKSSKGYAPHEMKFSDTLTSGESACYVFEIPRHMISSPYCFKAEK